MNNFRLFSMFVRTFFLQSAWNFARMQNIGFSFVVEPSLKRIYPDAENLKDALRRHLEFFNTHPYLAGLMAAMTVRLEENAAQNDPSSRAAVYSRIVQLKERMCGPLAAIGDGCFWSGWRTTSALSAILAGGMVYLWIAAGQRDLYAMQYSRLAPFVPACCFLILYNAFSLPLRAAMVWAGYRWGESCAVEIARYPVQKGIAAIRRSSLFLLAAVVVCFAVGTVVVGRPDWLLAFTAFPVFVAALRRGISVSKIFYFTVAAIVLVRSAVRIFG